MQANEAKRRIAKVGHYHLALFLLPMLTILYYAWLQAPELNERADNPQRVAPLSKRGRLLGQDGKLWARSLNGERDYPIGEAGGPLIGYQLRGRNGIGLESALQTELSPPLPPSSLQQALQQDREIRSGNRKSLQGPDIVLTLQSDMQRALYRVLSPLTGALVVADDQGAILAAVSSPSFDPRQVREKWQQLRDDERGPFVERVGSGLYPVTRRDGASLLNPTDSTAHNWFESDPFPNYPNSSAAAWIDGRLLLTPLMLLEASYGIDADASAAPPELSLLKERNPQRPPSPIPIQVSAEQSPNGLRICTLGVPQFRGSPQFLAAYGVTAHRLHFALVIESADESARIGFEKCLRALAEYRGGRS